MSEFIQISDLSRRDAIRRIALALTAAGAATTGALDIASAQHVHKEVKSSKGAAGDYTPKLLTEHEFQTVSKLAELIVPADERSGSAVDAGAPEFIDLLCSQNETLARIYTSGIGWLDARMRHRYDSTFVEASGDQQTEMLDLLVEAQRNAKEPDVLWDRDYSRFHDYGLEKRSDLGAGVRFFDWVRKMSVDAYYTSEIGIKDLGYIGNEALSEFVVPEEAIAHAMKAAPRA